MYKYPADLAAVAATLAADLAPRVGTAPPVGSRSPGVPPLDVLTRVVETCFVVSMQRDEGRDLKFSVLLSAEGESEPEFPAFSLTDGLALTDATLRKLVPCASAEGTAIEVTFGAAGLRLSGIVNVGAEWSRTLEGFGYGFVTPSGTLIGVRGPGQLTISFAGEILAELRDGRLVASPGTAEQLLPPQPLVMPGLKMALRGVASPEAEPFEDACRFELIAYFNVYIALLNRVRQLGHGGTVVVVGAEAIGHPNVHLKYRIDESALTVAYRGFIVQRGILGDAKRREPEGANGASDQVQLALARTDRAFHCLIDLIGLVASLSAADGAILLRTDFRVLGFGGELSAASCVPAPTITEFDGRRVCGGQGVDGRPWDVGACGMRHRSAVSLCGASEPAFAYVISQDGPVTAVRRSETGVEVFRGISTRSLYGSGPGLRSNSGQPG